MSERWRIEPEYAIKVDSSLGLLGVLLEPMTVITKALEQIFVDRPARLLGTQDGAGDRRRTDRPAGGSPIECAGSSMSMSLTGSRPDRSRRLVRALGATYHSGSVLDLGFQPGRHCRVHGCWVGDRRLHPEGGRGRDHLSDGRRRRRDQPAGSWPTWRQRRY